MNNKVVMFAASQGGHYKELMGLRELFSKYQSILVTDNQMATQQIDVISEFQTVEILHAMYEARAKSAESVKKIRRINNTWSYIKMFIECLKTFHKYKPSVLISTGSHIAVPLFVCAKLYGARTIFIESNAMVYSKTTTGRIVEKLSDKIYVQWPEMKKIYPQAEYYGVLN